MVTLKVDNQAHLYPASELPGSVLNQIKDRLTFPNPAYREAEKRGFSTWNVPQQITGYRQEGGALIAPRGFTQQLVGILRGAGVQYRLEDRRRTLPAVDFTFRGYAAEPETAPLPVGDYSLPGFEDRVSIERKSLDDLAGWFTIKNACKS